MALRRKGFDKRDYPMPPTIEPAQSLQSRQVRARCQRLAELVAARDHLEAVKDVASEICKTFYQGLPVRNAAEERAYLTYKYVSDAVESIFLKIHEEAESGFQDLRGDDPAGGYQPTAYDEEEEQWMDLGMNLRQR